MNNKQTNQITDAIYESVFVVFGIVTTFFLLFFTPVGDLLVDMFGVGGLYGVIPFGLYVIAAIRNDGLAIILLFPLIASIISCSVFMSLIGHSGTLIDGGIVGHEILKISFVNLDGNEYLKIFGVSLGSMLLSIYLLFIFARGIYATRKRT